MRRLVYCRRRRRSQSVLGLISRARISLIFARASAGPRAGSDPQNSQLWSAGGLLLTASVNACLVKATRSGSFGPRGHRRSCRSAAVRSVSGPHVDLVRHRLAGRSAERAHLVIRSPPGSASGKSPAGASVRVRRPARARGAGFPADPLPGARSPGAPDGEAGWSSCRAGGVLAAAALPVGRTGRGSAGLVGGVLRGRRLGGAGQRHIRGHQAFDGSGPPVRDGELRRGQVADE
jgi:hypothetical protein